MTFLTMTTTRLMRLPTVVRSLKTRKNIENKSEIVGGELDSSQKQIQILTSGNFDQIKVISEKGLLCNLSANQKRGDI